MIHTSPSNKSFFINAQNIPPFMSINKKTVSFCLINKVYLSNMFIKQK